MLQRYFIQLSYKGTNYHGWQIQSNAITVQQVVNDALKILLRQDVETTGAGRTDTGVHASFFMAHFDCEHIELEKNSQFLLQLNSILPKDISIQKILKVQNSAHARYDALSRTYEYHMTLHKDPFNTEFAYYLFFSPDVDKMNAAAGILLEYTDFTSFSKLHTDVKTNNCKISLASWTKENDEIVFKITADRFLRNMVRAIVGTLIDVGLEKMSMNDLRKVIEIKNRSSAGVSVPSKGLFLTGIDYPSSLFLNREEGKGISKKMQANEKKNSF